MNPSMLCELQLHGFIVISIFFVQGQCLLLANVWALVKEEEEKKNVFRSVEPLVLITIQSQKQ